jgi:hypothetical protein
LHLLINDLEIVTRSSSQNKKISKSARHRSTGKGKWLVTSSMARLLSISVTDLIIKVFFTLLNFLWGFISSVPQLSWNDKALLLLTISYHLKFMSAWDHLLIMDLWVYGSTYQTINGQKRMNNARSFAYQATLILWK